MLRVVYRGDLTSRYLVGQYTKASIALEVMNNIKSTNIIRYLQVRKLRLLNDDQEFYTVEHWASPAALAAHERSKAFIHFGQGVLVRYETQRHR
jgi:hypothetical protein